MMIAKKIKAHITPCLNNAQRVEFCSSRVFKTTDVEETVAVRGH
jgi:hypothetical protein